MRFDAGAAIAAGLAGGAAMFALALAAGGRWRLTMDIGRFWKRFLGHPAAGLAAHFALSAGIALLYAAVATALERQPPLAAVIGLGAAGGVVHWVAALPVVRLAGGPLGRTTVAVGGLSHVAYGVVTMLVYRALAG